MSPGFNTIFLALAALVSVGMWLDYFKRIDVFEKEKLWPLLITLVIGGGTPYLCLFVYHWLEALGFKENGLFWNDLAFAILGVGLNEELCKMAGVVAVFQVFKKQINEPIDRMIYAGVTALGFSMVENYYYFTNHGVQIMTSRSFYSALEHIINTSIIVYGYYRYSLFNKGNPIVNTVFGVILATGSHGLFDFFLAENVAGPYAVLFSLVIYLVGINFWIQMLNNANNYSNFFDYDKIHFSSHVAYRLLAWYLVTLVITFVNNLVAVDLQFSVIALLYGLVSDGFLFFIVILRVSRFKIFRQQYLPVTIGFPFYITKNSDEDFRIPFINLPIKIRGENHREHLLTRYLNRRMVLTPLAPDHSFLKVQTLVTLTGKHLLVDDVVVYAIAMDDGHDDRRFYIKPRVGGIREWHNQLPVEGLYEMKVEADKVQLLNYKDLHFLEWVTIHPQEVVEA